MSLVTKNQDISNEIIRKHFLLTLPHANDGISSICHFANYTHVYTSQTDWTPSKQSHIARSIWEEMEKRI